MYRGTVYEYRLVHCTCSNLPQSLSGFLGLDHVTNPYLYIDGHQKIMFLNTSTLNIQKDMCNINSNVKKKYQIYLHNVKFSHKLMEKLRITCLIESSKHLNFTIPQAVKEWISLRKKPDLPS